MPPALQHDASDSRPHSKAGEVFVLLRRDILNGTLAPGSKLGLVVLRERYDSGVAPLREALIKLASAGLAVGEEQRGFRVSPISEEDLHDITRVSIMVETDALGRAIQRADAQSDAHLQSTFDEMLSVPVLEPGSQAVMSEAWASAHRRFHASLAAPCASPWLMTIRSMLFDQADRYRRLSFALDPRRDMDAEHRRLLRAVLDRDTATAGALLQQHWSSTASIIDAKAPPQFLSHSR